MKIKLVVGLGNPGKEYKKTRHNVGFRVIDELAKAIGKVKFKKRYHGEYMELDLPAFSYGRVGLLKPQTYMNRSGLSVGDAKKSLGIEAEDIIIVHDELDLPLGKIKIKKGGGTAGHKGLESIKDALGTSEFIRVRIGIDKKAGNDAASYVLERFRTDEEVILENEILPLAKEAVISIIKDGLEKAMNNYNR